MSPLNTECHALLANSINPYDVIFMARQLGVPELIQRAFPTMPAHATALILAGSYDIERLSEGMTSNGESFIWCFNPKPCTTSALEDQCYEDATIEAAEICGPNSHEYDSLVESISERLFSERQPA